MNVDRFQALVLNADYMPLSVFPLSLWSMTRTLRNLLEEKVVVVAEYDAILRSPSVSYKPPSVVALRRYVKRPSVVPFTRFNVYLRDRFHCQYCNTKFETHKLSFDHVVPRSAGGESTFKNIVTACFECNNKKGNRTDIKPIREPYEPSPYELARVRRTLPTNYLHESWIDYLYWDASIDK